VSELKTIRCEPCEAGTLALSEEDRARYLPQIPEWSVRRVDDIERLERAFAFQSYTAAVDFTVRVAEIAEKADHHPAILLEWGRVTVSWWTHTVGGLHLNDLVLAARTDLLYDES